MTEQVGSVVFEGTPADCKESLEFDGAITIAQIIQGVAFLGLAIILIFLNNAKIGAGSKAPLEQRYMTSLTIATAVCLFSGFFNILQMTGLDDFELPRSSNFTLDLSRPVEWLLTCPVMQLILVILGGARLPSYRKFMMPLLTAANLLCGVAAMFSAGGMQWAWFCFGFMLWSTYTYYNVQQIKENSDGDEGLLHGDSDYRKLSVITILTWFPFPLWFIVSPEGLGLVTDITVIQLGWAVLNVISKFGFILHLQHIKSKYCKTLEATRELYGVQPGQELPQAQGVKELGDGEENQIGDDAEEGEQKVITLVTETMISLGMSSHTERFLKLMLDNGIVSVDILERLTQERAMDLNLPWSLCDSVQRRWKAEKLNLGQDRGGAIEKEDPFKKLLAEGKSRRKGQDGLPGQMPVGQLPDWMYEQRPGTHTPPYASSGPVASDSRVAAMEMKLEHVMSTLMSMSGVLETVASKVEKFDSSQEAICQRLDFAQQAQLQTLNSSQVMLHKIDSSQEDVLHKIGASKDILDQVKASQNGILETLTGSSDSAKRDLLDSMENSSKALLKKLDSSQQELLTKQGDSLEILSKVSKSQNQVVQKLDMGQEAASRRSLEAEQHMDAKLKELRQEVLNTCDTTMNQLGKSMGKDMGNLAAQSNQTVQTLENGMAMQEERMADVRRQNMMIMDMLTGTQERVMQSADSIQSFARRDLATDGGMVNQAKLEVELRGVVATEMARMQRELETALMGTPHHDELGAGLSNGGLLGQAAERLEAAAKRLESSDVGGKSGTGCDAGIEEVVRREISAAAMALAQQQRDIAEQQVGQVRDEVGQKVRVELQETAEKISTRVDKFEGSLDAGIERLEQGVNKVLSSAGSSGEGGSNRRKSANSAAERG